MIKLSIKFDLSLGKILLGFAGVSVAVCAYKFCSSNNNEEVSCSDDEDIIPSVLKQRCCSEDKIVKSTETSHELVSVAEELFVGRNKLLINLKKVKIPKIKPVVICPEPKVSPAVSCMDLNEVSEVKEVLETDNCSTRVENQNKKSIKNKDFTQVRNDISTQVENENSTLVENENFTQVENNSSMRIENEVFLSVENKNFTQVENENFRRAENEISTQVESKDSKTNYVFEKNYLTKALFEIFHNQQNFIVVKHHINELKNVLTQMENTELSAVNMVNLILKRLEQLQCKTTRFFTFDSHQIEVKAWENYLEETDNKRKTVQNFTKVLNLINQFYGDRIKFFEKTAQISKLKLKSKEPYKYDLKKFLDYITTQINLILSCITYLDVRLVETVEKINALFQSSYSSAGMNVNFSDEVRNLTFKADLFESKQIFDSLVTNLRVDRLSNNVLTQKKLLEEILTDLSSREATSENFTTLINKRIKQLQEASGENNLLSELFSCELTKWTSLSTDPNSSAKFPKDVFEDINLCYGYLITASGNTDHMKLKPGNGIQIDCNEINGLLECYKSLLDIAWSIDNLLFLLILKVVINLQSELITIM